jgi:hypothetical protein
MLCLSSAVTRNSRMLLGVLEPLAHLIYIFGIAAPNDGIP